MNKTRILIADDHKIVRKGLAALFQTTDDLCVAGEASDGEEAVAEALRLRPDVVIMDLMMPVKGGTAAAAEIHEKLPNTRILILTTFGSADGLAHALESGASGALLKSDDDELIIEAIRSVAAGHRCVSPEIERLLAEDPPVPELTARQLEILEAVTRGLTNAEIATMLGIRQDSVKKLVMAVCEKIGASNRTEAAVIALRKHLLKI